MGIQRLSKYLNKFMGLVLFFIPCVFLFVFGTHIFFTMNETWVVYTAIVAVVIAAIGYAAARLPQKLHLPICFVPALALRFLCLVIWQIEPLSDCKLGYDISYALSNARIGQWSGIMAESTYYYKTWCMHVPFILYQTFCMNIFGDSIVSIQIFNCLFSAISCIMAYKIAEAVYKKKDIALAAGLLMAVNPTCLLMSAFLVNQHVSTAMLLVSVYFILAKPCKKDISNTLWSAVFLAFGQLMRPEMHIVVIAYVCFNVYLCISKPSRRAVATAVRNVLIFVVIFFLIISVTDAVLKGFGMIEGSITQSNLKYKLMIGLNQETEGRFLDSDYLLAGDDAAVEKLLKERLSSVPETVMLFFKKWVFQFSSYNYWWLQADKGGAARQMFINEGFEPLLQSFMMFILLAAAVQCLKNYFKPQDGFAYMNIIFIGYLCSFALIEVQQRYTYMLIPVFTVLGAKVLPDIPKKIKKRAERV